MAMRKAFDNEAKYYMKLRDDMTREVDMKITEKNQSTINNDTTEEQRVNTQNIKKQLEEITQWLKKL